MDNLDYYTVMESRIKYFSKKYDPQNKLGAIGNPALRIKKAVIPAPLKKTSARKKILERMDSVISLFL
jgi:hypothetical protein